MRQCKADGCFMLTKGYSSYCERHKRNLARHGHPHQKGIKKADLKPYRRAVRAFLHKQTSSDPKAILEGIWNRTTDEARSFIKQAEQGRPYNGHQMQAHQAILSLAKEQDAGTIGEVLMAMGYWLEFAPRFWRHDDGFRYQTVRMLLRLNPKEAAYQWYDGKMTRSVYRDVPPKTTEYLWAIVVNTELVSYGAEIARRDAKAIERRRVRAEEERLALLGSDPEVAV